MNKKNLILIVSLSATGVAALVLLIFVVIIFFQWSEYRDRTDAARNKIVELNKQTPAPGEENAKRIRQDIDLYEQAGRKLVDHFKSPLIPAAEAFVEALPPPLAEKLTDEEKELYGEAQGGEGESDGEEERKSARKIRKLKYSEIRKFFSDRFNKFCADRNVSDEERNSMTTLNRFHEECRSIFPGGAWDKAMDKFLARAAKDIYEPVNKVNGLPLLLMAFGAPRRVDRNVNALKRQVDDMIEHRIVPEAGKFGLELGDEALNFIGGSGREKDTALAPADDPYAFFHWDVFGDIVSRLGSAKAASLQRVILRRNGQEAASDLGEGGGGGASVLAGAFEQVGSYRLYHYTIVFTGTMDAVREAMRRFDGAHAENRMYVVRGLALYAKENGAAVVMGQVLKNADGSSRSETPASDDGSRRRGRRRRPRVETAAPDGVGGGNMTEEEARRHIAEQEKNLPPEQRTGYAEPLIGADRECIAYLDVDYVVLEQNE